MINVLMDEHDGLFRSGLEFVLSGFFKESYGLSTQFLQGVNEENISQADVIMLTMCAGQALTCIPEIKHNNKRVLIAFVENIPVNKLLPFCFSEMNIVSRKITLQSFVELLREKWEGRYTLHREFSARKCRTCNRKMLSPQQLRLCKGLSQGETMTEIAEKMNVSDRTVMSHKYLLMKKFDLHCDKELVEFLRYIRPQLQHPLVP